MASHSYPLTTLASTCHAGWTEATANINLGQKVHVTWHVNSGGIALLEARPAWDPQAPWQELDRWSRSDGAEKKGEVDLPVPAPTLLRLRVKGPKFPRSGIAQLQVKYERRTLAALRGDPNADRRPVIVAEGYDPFNGQDLNDTGWQAQPAFSKLVNEGHTRDHLDPWILDWGDGGASLEQQAEDFAEIARLVKAWNGGRRGTVALGISMGAVSLRYALAKASDAGDDLGVVRYVSLNGPQQGAWVNPELLKFLLKRAKTGSGEPLQGTEAYFIRRGLDNPAAQELLIGGPKHDAFYAELRGHGKGGYAPGIPRVAFSNGSLTKEGNELAELGPGKRHVVHRVSASVLGLPVWFTAHRTREEFRFDGFPGELLPESLRGSVHDHARVLGIIRFDWKAAWETVPTFIPTHSALDFPDELTGDETRLHYSRWRESSFSTVYVAPGRNLPHDVQDVDWIDPRTGKGAPDGRNAVLYEVARAYAPGR